MKLAMTLFRCRNRLMGSIRSNWTVERAKTLFLTPRRFKVKPWEIEQEKKGCREVFSNGLSLIRWGQSTRKILLVHGWESRATQMSGFVDSLVAQGFQVCALDGPAHGHSSGTRADPYRFAQAISYVYQNAGPFEGIVGHSMGGSAVSYILASMTQKEMAELRKVVLISTPSCIRAVLGRFSRYIGLSQANGQKLVGLIEQTVGQPTSAFNTANNITALPCEVLIIHDKADREVPYEDALLITETFKTEQLVSTQGYGHRAIIRQDTVWNKVADFMS